MDHSLAGWLAGWLMHTSASPPRLSPQLPALQLPDRGDPQSLSQHSQFVCLHKGLLFLGCPGRLADVGPQVVVPALPALLANAS